MSPTASIHLPQHCLLLITIPSFFILQTSRIFIIPQKRLIIFDTKGNFYLSGMNCHFIPTAQVLLEKLLSLKKESDFVLLIDSITILIDCNIEFKNLKKYFNLIWELIYENNADVVLVDHYKMIQENENWIKKPRFYKNAKMFTHWILVDEKGNFEMTKV